MGRKQRQGRSKSQLEYSEKMGFFSFIGMIIIGLGYYFYTIITM